MCIHVLEVRVEGLGLRALGLVWGICVSGAWGSLNNVSVYVASRLPHTHFAVCPPLPALDRAARLLSDARWRCRRFVVVVGCYYIHPKAHKLGQPLCDSLAR